MNHPLNNMGWSEVRNRLCQVLHLATEYLELKIEKLKYEKELREKELKGGE